MDIKIYSLITSIIITSSIQGIIIPKLVTIYSSMYFLLVFIAFVFMCILFVAYIIIVRGIYEVKNTKYIVYIGFYNTLESVCMIYSANPSRTPILIQTILVGLVIIPSALLTKFYLKKDIEYNYKILFTSIFLLILSLGISCIPLYSEWNWMSIFWIALYSCGVISIACYNIMQEGTMTFENDFTTKHKISIIFCGSIVKLFFVLCCFGIEYLLGYGEDPKLSIFQDMLTFFENRNAKILLISFCFVYSTTCILAVNLNSYSTNMNMISSSMVNVVVITYYSIFPPENSIDYPIYIIVICMVLNIISIVLWHNGEKIKDIEVIPQ